MPIEWAASAKRSSAWLAARRRELSSIIRRAPASLRRAVIHDNSASRRVPTSAVRPSAQCTAARTARNRITHGRSMIATGPVLVRNVCTWSRSRISWTPCASRWVCIARVTAARWTGSTRSRCTPLAIPSSASDRMTSSEPCSR